MQNLISELKRASKALWVWKEHVYYDIFFFLNPVLGLSAAWAVTSKNYIMKEKKEKKKKRHAFNQKSNVFLTLKSGSRF